MAAPIFPIAITVGACVIGAFGALFLKFGSAKFSFNPLELVKNYKLMIGVCCYAISAVVFIYALKFVDVSVLYPFAATTYIWTALLSVKFLGEKMNKWKWLGIAAILAGVSLIGFGS